MITLIKSRIDSQRPDLLLLRDFEDYCAKHSNWQTVKGVRITKPLPVNTRMLTTIHSFLKPFNKLFGQKKIYLSLGLPYRIYLFSKNFPYFSSSRTLKILWTYDVWEPKFDQFAELVREAKINLLLLSSSYAARHFQKLNLPGCQVYWLHETLNTDDYHYQPASAKNIDVLSFGRVYRRYHDKIVESCKKDNIDYQYEKLNDTTDVALKGVNPGALQFPTFEDLKNALAAAKICICFPKQVTHPDQAGAVSTITLRYLQAMASKCIILGEIPEETAELFDYEPFIKVDWNNPYTQIRNILDNYDSYAELIEKNYKMVTTRFHYRYAIEKIQQLSDARFDIAQ